MITSYMESSAGLWDVIGADGSNRWQADGACAAPDVDPDLHFPATDGKTRPYSPLVEAQIADAKRMCAGCPVLKQCRAYGMTQAFGVWGGLDEDDRREIRREAEAISARERRAIKGNAASLDARRKTPAAVDGLAKGA